MWVVGGARERTAGRDVGMERMADTNGEEMGEGVLKEQGRWHLEVGKGREESAGRAEAGVEGCCPPRKSLGESSNVYSVHEIRVCPLALL